VIDGTDIGVTEEIDATTLTPPPTAFIEEGQRRGRRRS